MKKLACLFVLMMMVVLPALSLADIQENINNTENKTILPTKQEPANHSSETRTFDEADRGKLLYENHCTGCHSQSVHDKNADKVHSYKDIRQWTLRWSRILKLQWDSDDINTVTDYLNREFYHFPSQPHSSD